MQTGGLASITSAPGNLWAGAELPVILRENQKYRCALLSRLSCWLPAGMVCCCSQLTIAWQRLASCVILSWLQQGTHTASSVCMLLASTCRSTLGGMSQIARTEGLSALWRGINVSLLISVPNIVL